MDDVAGGAGKYYIVICKNGCGYMKAFDNFSDA